MSQAHARHRLLLVAGKAATAIWRSLIPEGWEVGVTADVEFARLARQARACDLMLVASDTPRLGDADAVRRLITVGPPPTVFVTHGSDGVDEVVLTATQSGAVWLPGDYAQRCPELLQAVLTSTLGQSDRQPAGGRAGEDQDRILRLVELMWQATPGTLPGPWFGQRYMLERLEEEIARSQRDGVPLSVVVGELQVEGEGDSALGQEQAAKLREWAGMQIGQNKRRCDVTGQYGLDGFMIVLPRANPEQARGACRRIRRVLAHPPQGLPPVRVHFGLAGVPGDRANVPGLLGRAEQRLDEARLRERETA